VTGVISTSASSPVVLVKLVLRLLEEMLETIRTSSSSSSPSTVLLLLFETRASASRDWCDFAVVVDDVRAVGASVYAAPAAVVERFDMARGGIG